MFTIEAKGNGQVKSTAKGKFIRKFMVKDGSGEVEIITVHANKLETLSGDGVIPLKIRPSSDFFFACE
jgi:hypothetical protein